MSNFGTNLLCYKCILMRSRIFVFLISVIFVDLACVLTDQNTVNSQSQKGKLVYPMTRKDSVVNDYFGVQVADPFRWLEDDRSKETEAWVQTQNECTFGYLKTIPFRDSLRKHIAELYDYEKFGTPIKKAGHYYFFKNDGLQNQDVLYGTKDIRSQPDKIIDPNQFSKEGTTALNSFSFSKDGKYMAFQVAEGGSDWNKIMVLDLESKTYLKDTIRWVKFSNSAWRGKGFYYSRYPEPSGAEYSQKNEYHAVYFHSLGTTQDKDELIYEDQAHSQRNAGVTVTEDNRFLILSTTESTSGNGLAFRDLNKKSKEFIWLSKDFKYDYTIVGNSGNTLFLLTNEVDPNWSLMAVDVNMPGRKHWKNIINASGDVLQEVRLIGGKLIAMYLHNASSLVKIFDLEGTLVHTLSLPELGTVSEFSGEQKDTEAFFSFSSFIRPPTIYRMDLNDFSTEALFSPKINGYNPDLYKTEQVWYQSKDGTKIPMFLTYQKALTKENMLKSPGPTLLYGYGGFDISLTPGFNVSRLTILENKGIFAVANIRGGGEFGKEWHLAGTRERKQNVFDDFIYASNYLVDNGYTDRNHLAIEGRSNGGLLIGACITQKPDLCKVAFPGVGVLDMLRYHEFTIGWAWATDYGTSKSKLDFDYLIRYSPLHNARPASYPATLITTADHDDRVVPAHSFKFAAALQTAQQGENPVLIRIDVSAGHGAGKPTSKRIDETTDMMSFMFFNMGLKPIL